MKKSNKKGFILAETIAVSVVIMTCLVIVYTQFMTISKSYSRTFTYNSVNNLYLVNNIKNFIKKDGIDKMIETLDSVKYIDITSCSTDYFIEYASCRSLIENSNIKQIIFTRQNLKELENNLDNNLSEKMKQFIKFINYGDTNNYRLIVEFNDETYATLNVSNNEEFAMEPAIFDYTGEEQVFTVPHTGYYKLEAWGAQGGTAYSTYQTIGYSYGGLGAYTSGTIYLEEGEKIYVYVGGRGIDNTQTSKNVGIVAGGYNGGGAGYGRDNGNSYVHNGASGGGATDFRYFGDSTPSESDLLWNSTLGLNSRIMVAAGGGGGSGHNGNANGGSGGTLVSGNVSSNFGSATGVNQTSGNAFGIGGATPTTGGGGGGAGGYYGGRTANWVQGTGGSSYISGASGCIAIKSATDRTPKVTTYSKIEDSYHYSGKIFENSVMISGNGSMPTHDGQEKMNGNSGNGYAKISYINSIDENIESIQEFVYTGSEQKFVIPESGYYKLETWGAQGGNVDDGIGGYGGYTTGIVYLEEGENIYINVGGQGKKCNLNSGACTSTGGYNGGGYAYSSNQTTSGGGGATHIAKTSGLLSTLSQNQNQILLVAGGGGGSGHGISSTGTYHYGPGGSGNGYIAQNGTDINYGSFNQGFFGSGGTQSSGGRPYSAGKIYSNTNGIGVFGRGGQYSSALECCGNSGGGGGYYGGGASTRGHGGGGGGSGYIGNSSLINKYMYCYNCSTSDDESTRTYSTTNVSGTPISKYVKKGDGYAKITYVGQDDVYLWVTGEELEMYGYSIDDENIEKKKVYRYMIFNETIDTISGGSYSCSDRATCSYNSCTTGTSFTSQPILGVSGSCNFSNVHAQSGTNVSCYIQGYNGSSWITLATTSGYRNSASQITLSPASANTQYPTMEFTQIRTCWSMNDQNSLTIKGNATILSESGSWSEWIDCSDECPASDDTKKIETSVLYKIVLQ